MRKLLLILLAVVMPLKAVAAAVVPITGGWAHAQHSEQAVADDATPLDSQHVGHMHAAPHVTVHDATAAEVAASAATAADAVSDAVPADGSTHSSIHDHPCPHMGMASMAVAAALAPATYAKPELAAELPVQFNSVVHEVPYPPPTFLH